jgi:hypothetical protein
MSNILRTILLFLQEFLNPNLSNHEIEYFMRKFKISGKVILYRELPRYFNKFDQGYCYVIFFGFDGNIGHWYALWKDQDGTIHFFDPCGEPPDAQ